MGACSLCQRQAQGDPPQRCSQQQQQQQRAACPSRGLLSRCVGPRPQSGVCVASVCSRCRCCCASVCKLISAAPVDSRRAATGLASGTAQRSVGLLVAVTRPRVQRRSPVLVAMRSGHRCLLWPIGRHQVCLRLRRHLPLPCPPMMACPCRTRSAWCASTIPACAFCFPAVTSSCVWSAHIGSISVRSAEPRLRSEWSCSSEHARARRSRSDLTSIVDTTQGGYQCAINGRSETR